MAQSSGGGDTTIVTAVRFVHRLGFGFDNEMRIQCQSLSFMRNVTLLTFRIRPLIDREVRGNLGIHWKEEKATSSWYVKQCDPKNKKVLPPQPGAPDYCYDR